MTELISYNSQMNWTVLNIFIFDVVDDNQSYCEPDVNNFSYLHRSNNLYFYKSIFLLQDSHQQSTFRNIFQHFDQGLIFLYILCWNI